MRTSDIIPRDPVTGERDYEAYPPDLSDERVDKEPARLIMRGWHVWALVVCIIVAAFGILIIVWR